MIWELLPAGLISVDAGFLVSSRLDAEKREGTVLFFADPDKTDAELYVPGWATVRVAVTVPGRGGPAADASRHSGALLDPSKSA